VTYFFAVKAFNTSLLHSEYSAEVSHTALTIAPAVTGLAVSHSSASGLEFIWDASDADRRVTGYELRLDEVFAFAPAIMLETTDPAGVVAGLKPGTDYAAMVRARNAAGFSDYSDSVAARTAVPMIRLTIQRGSDLLGWQDTETVLEVDDQGTEFFRLKIEKGTRE
jgi:hypothetical protein